MSNGIAAGCTLAGVVWLSGYVAQTESQHSTPKTAHAADRHPAKSRYLVDAARSRAWSLTRDGVSLHDVTKAKAIAVTLPGWRWAGAPFGCPPALALGPKGEAIITSDVLPMLWRVDPETLAVSVHSPALDGDADKDLGFSALTYSAKHGAYFALSHSNASLWRIDPFLRTAQKTPLAATAAKTCGLALWSRAGSGKQTISAAFLKH
ncbi:MAG: hypothetical protein HYS35_08770 [Betaproteobacteria bacterium]|nr:hypothetical protein [Betaproteobacteria bacterium]